MTATAEPILAETEILDRVREIVLADPKKLDMNSWHSQDEDGDDFSEFDCGTTHCLAGWAQCLSRRQGDPESIGRELLPVTAGTVGFYCSDKIATAWLKSRGYASDADANAFRDELIGLGWEHVTGERSRVSGGEVWADGQSKVDGVSGGVVRAYGQSKVDGVSGGVVRAYGQSKVDGVSGGEVWADGQSKVDGVSGGVVRVRSPEVQILSARNCTVINERWTGLQWQETGRTVYDADGN